jgi:hypothetical protein
MRLIGQQLDAPAHAACLCRQGKPNFGANVQHTQKLGSDTPRRPTTHRPHHFQTLCTPLDVGSTTPKYGPTWSFQILRSTSTFIQPLESTWCELHVHVNLRVRETQDQYCAARAKYMHSRAEYPVFELELCCTAKSICGLCDCICTPYL